MTERSEEAVARALSAVLRDHGWALAANAKRLRAALNDVMGSEADEHRGAIDAIVLAVEEGIVAELHEVGRDGAGPVLPVLVERLAGWGLSGGRATWATLAWAAELPEATLAPPRTTEPPGTESRTQRPTTLPPAVNAASEPARPAPVHAGDGSPAARVPSPAPTALPPPAPFAGPSSGTGQRRRPSRRMAVVGVAVAVVAGGAGAFMSLSGNDHPPASERRPTSAGARVDQPPPPAEAGTVVRATSARVPVVERRAAMGSDAGGVRVARLGVVETVGSGPAERSAPEGGRLIAFRLVDWRSCATRSCRPWTRLGLMMRIGDEEQRLPGGDADTFIVAVPAGVKDVALVMKAHGMIQSLSLVTGEPGPRNVTVLARPGRVDRIGAHFPLTEHTSIELNYGDRVTDTVPREVSVTRAELVFFTPHGHPSSPDNAFLKVRAGYTIPFGSNAGKPYAFYLSEVAFVGQDGTLYKVRDIDEGTGVDAVDAVFEVPATLRGGTFRIGGTETVTSSGRTFTRTVTQRSIPIRFG